MRVVATGVAVPRFQWLQQCPVPSIDGTSVTGVLSSWHRLHGIILDIVTGLAYIALYSVSYPIF